MLLWLITTIVIIMTMPRSIAPVPRTPGSGLDAVPLDAVAALRVPARLLLIAMINSYY